MILTDDTIILDGLSSCLIGLDARTGKAIYSYDKLLDHFLKDGLKDIEAIDWIDFNIVNISYVIVMSEITYE